MRTERCNDEQEEQQKLESKENSKEKTKNLKKKKKKSVHKTGWITLENTVRQKKQKLIHSSVYPNTY